MSLSASRVTVAQLVTDARAFLDEVWHLAGRYDQTLARLLSAEGTLSQETLSQVLAVVEADMEALATRARELRLGAAAVREQIAPTGGGCAA